VFCEENVVHGWMVFGCSNVIVSKNTFSLPYSTCHSQEEHVLFVMLDIMSLSRRTRSLCHGMHIWCLDEVCCN